MEGKYRHGESEDERGKNTLPEKKKMMGENKR